MNAKKNVFIIGATSEPSKDPLCPVTILTSKQIDPIRLIAHYSDLDVSIK